MGLQQDYIDYLNGLTDPQVEPIEASPPVNDTPGNLASLFDEVTQRLREGVGDFAIAAEYGLNIGHVQIARALWDAEVAERRA